MLALALWSGHQYRQLARESDALAALATQEQGLAEALGAATARAQAEATQRANLDPTALRDQRDALLALLRDLGEPGSAGSARFSTLLMGLARQDFDGVWLDRIEVSAAGQALALHGRTLSARNVPLLLTRLHDEPAFAGRRFGQFAIEREKGTTGPLRFHVATRASEAETDGSPR